jgi:hypothetical protein
MDIQFDFKVVGPVLAIMLTIFLSLWFAIIPTESTEENRPLLWALLCVNLFLGIALFLLLYVFNDKIASSGIIHVAMIFTFLMATPVTLYNLGVTSLIYSNA